MMQNDRGLGPAVLLWCFCAAFAALSSGCSAPAQKTQSRAAHDTAAQDTAAQDTAAQDTAAQDTAAQDTAAQDTAAQDTATQDTATQDATGAAPQPPATCSTLFTLAATAPKAQKHAALSGDFLTPVWPKSTTEGAIKMTLNPAKKRWEVSVTAAHGQLVRYKFVVGWSDNPGPVWVNQQGKADNSPNSVIQVDCGPAAGLPAMTGKARVAWMLKWWIAKQLKQQGFVGLGAFVRKGQEQQALASGGMADKAKAIAVDVDKTLFRWASMSKMIAGILAAQLAAEGVVDLDKPVQAYLAGYKPPSTFVSKCKSDEEKTFKGIKYTCKSGLFTFPLSAAEQVITLRQLLSHTGGIAHYTNGQGTPSPPQKLADDQLFNTGPKWALGWLYDKPLIGVPGTKSSYSTHGMNLGGVTLAQPGKTSFEQLSATRVFKVLGMTTAQVDKEWLKLPNRAVGYDRDSSGKVYAQDSNDVSWKLPGGGFVSTVADLDRFCLGLVGDKVLNAAQKNAAWTKAKLKNGKSVSTGLAFGIGGRGGRSFVGHSGSQQKAKTILRLFSKDKLCIGLMTNSTWANTGKLAASLEDDVRAVWAL